MSPKDIQRKWGGEGRREDKRRERRKKEKEGKAWIASPLREIPQEQPSLTRAPKVLKKIDKLYEKAPGREEVADRLREAAGKLSDCSEGTDKKETERLLGDTLLLLCEIARREKIPAEQVLMDRIEELIEEKER